MPNEPRLTGTSYAVLGLIHVTGPCTPYDLKQRIETTVENFWPVPHTTFYVEPARLAEAGLLSVEQEGDGRRRKVYSLTGAGRTALEAWVGEPVAQPPQVRDELMLKLFLGADPGPLIEERLEWQRAKLTELQGYLDVCREHGGPEGVERSLVAGTAYHRGLIAMLEGLRA
jgi:PadR family transcriptional regulator, regulatory protein AphA